MDRKIFQSDDLNHSDCDFPSLSFTADNEQGKDSIPGIS